MENIITAIIGVVCIVIGIINRKGNISTLHSYHRNRVSEKDRLPFGKMVGLGMIIIGVSMIIMGALSFIATILQNNLYLTLGSAALIVGLVIGLGITFYAMIKYNKGIF